jgi:5-methylcytosine-specific restriction endonuclease McrA
MTLNTRQQGVFMRRSQEAFQAIRRRARAAGVYLDYRLDDLQAFVRNNLGDRRCQYCRGDITVDNFALDHRNPIERTGSLIFHNLAVVCEECAIAKGSLDYVEFKELMELVRTWSPPVQKHFRQQLRLGGHQVPPLRVRWPAGCATTGCFPAEPRESPRSRRPADPFTAECAETAEANQEMTNGERRTEN